MRKLKVLLLLHELSRTGAPKIALDLFEDSAVREAVDVRIVSGLPGPLEERARRLSPVFLPSAPLRQGRIAWRLDRWARKRLWKDWLAWQADLIYINSVVGLKLAAKLEKNGGLPDAPIILHVHELHSYVATAMAEMPDWLTSRPARYIAGSTAVQQCLTEICGINPSRIATIHEWVREQDFAHLSPRAAKPTSAAAVVGGCGKPGWRKGTTLWLLAAREILRRRATKPPIRFTWVGTGVQPAGDPFQIELGKLGLSGDVECVPSTSVPMTEFSKFDVFAMTSVEDPFPLVTLENMMLGVPIICFDGGGLPEQVGDAGIVVPGFCPDLMADEIMSLIDSPARCKQLGAAGRKRVVELFTDRVAIPKLLGELMALSGRRL